MRKILKKFIYISLFVFLSLFASYFLEAILSVMDWYKYKEILGFTGVSLILLSFFYSIVKRKSKVKNMIFFLRLHMALAIAGTVIIFTHASFNHKFIFPVLTYCFLFIVYFSGFVGSFLVRDVKQEMEACGENQAPDHAIILVSKAVAVWRTVHIPLVTYLFIFLVIHIVSTIYYYGFRL